MNTGEGRVIDTAAILVEATENAFAQLTGEEVKTPPEAVALLDAGLVAIRAIRDNPAILTSDPKILHGMQEIVFAITAAAGYTRAIYLEAAKVPSKVVLN